jgi:glycogen operon protein
VFRRRRFFKGETGDGELLPDIGWYRPDGEQMTGNDWHRGDTSAIAVLLNGNSLGLRTVAGRMYAEKLLDNSYLVLFNGGPSSTSFTIPAGLTPQRWVALLDTASWGETSGRATAVERAVRPVAEPVVGAEWKVGAWALVLLEREPIEP